MPRRANVLTADCVQVDDSAFPQSLLNDMDEAATTTSRATAEARRCVRPVDERSSTARDMFQKSLSKSMSSYYKAEDARLLFDQGAEHLLLDVDEETWKLVETTRKIVAESRSARTKEVRALNNLNEYLAAKKQKK